MRRPDRGASAVEYGMLVAGIAGLIVSIAFGLGHVVTDSWSPGKLCLLNSSC